MAKTASSRRFWFLNLPIRAQVVAMLAVYIVVLIALAVSLSLAARDPRAAITLHDQAQRRATLGTRVVSSMLDVYSDFITYLATGDPTSLEQLGTSLNTYRTDLAAMQNAVAGDPAATARWRDIRTRSIALWEGVSRAAAARRAELDAGEGDAATLLAFLTQNGTRTDYLALRSRIDAYVEEQQQLAATTGADLTRVADRLAMIYLVGTLILLLFGCLVALDVDLDIARPIKRVTVAARALAEGQLDRRLRWRRTDEIGEMAATFDLMAARLQQLIQAQAVSLRELRASQGILEAMLHNSADGLVLFSPDHRILMVNERLAAFVGIDRQALQGRDLASLMPLLRYALDQPEAALPRVIRLIENPAQHELALTQRAPVSRELQVTATSVPGESGEPPSRLFTVRDVTRERESARVKAGFVSTVSHELRTPLTSIKGYVDLLLDGEVGALAPEQLQFLRIVASSTDRLMLLIDDLLDLSKLDSGKLALVRAPVDLGLLVRQVVREQQPRLDAKSLRLRLDLLDEPLPLLGDSNRLLQVVDNLVSNAIKYTPVAGELWLSVTGNRDAITFTLADSGIGMTGAEQAQAFDSFFRADHPLVAGAGGTGLGLTITRSLVELHGGTIRLASAPGQGTIFTVTLPRPRLLDGRADGAAPDLPAVRPPILVIAESAMLAMPVLACGDRLGGEVLVALAAADGLALARARPPALIVLVSARALEAHRDLARRLQAEACPAPILVVSCAATPAPPDGNPGAAAALALRVRRALGFRPPLTLLLSDAEAPEWSRAAPLFAAAGYTVLTAAGDGAIAAAPRLADVDVAFVGHAAPGHGAAGPAWRRLAHLRADPRTRALPVIALLLSREPLPAATLATLLRPLLTPAPTPTPAAVTSTAPPAPAPAPDLS